MDYEKLYRDTINNLQQMVNSGKITAEIARGICADFVPESEDERIKKEIITYLSTVEDKELIPYEPWIAWLEKQGEHANFRNKIQIGDKVTRNEDGVLVNLSQLNRVAKKDEKQGEQKPANKVEPKFKVGDWVANTVGDTNQVVKVLDDGYTLDDNTFLSNSWVTEHYHLWTIQDAKDGDVLFTSSTASHETFIFKSIDEKGNVKCYFAYDSEDGFREGKYHFIGRATNCKPATKEQRDTLFAKMKEAGYEWDAEKKELKEIEQNPISIDLKKADVEFNNILKDKVSFETLKMLLETWWKNTRTIIKEQKPLEWSEEDESMLETAIKSCEQCGNYYATPWLKSLRPQSQWKPSDEHYELEEFAKIVRGNLTGISKAVQKLFEAKYLQLTGNKMYGGFKD